MPKKNRIPKSGPVWRRSAEEATLDKMPKYNAHACGTGPHGDAKYNRAREKQAWKRELDRQGVRNRGPLLFSADPSAYEVEQFALAGHAEPADEEAVGRRNELRERPETRELRFPVTEAVFLPRLITEARFLDH
jgi:hypothetical protein